jgi:hypothetical protein
MRNLVVAFDAQVWLKQSKKSKKGFKFPAGLARVFGFEDRSPVGLVISKASGEEAFCGTALLTSDREVTRAEVFRKLDFGEEIRVTAYKPGVTTTATPRVP